MRRLPCIVALCVVFPAPSFVPADAAAQGTPCGKLRQGEQERHDAMLEVLDSQEEVARSQAAQQTQICVEKGTPEEIAACQETVKKELLPALRAIDNLRRSEATLNSNMAREILALCSKSTR
jgi:hypothetical protein